MLDNAIQIMLSIFPYSPHLQQKDVVDGFALNVLCFYKLKQNFERQEKGHTEKIMTCGLWSPNKYSIAPILHSFQGEQSVLKILVS